MADQTWTMRAWEPEKSTREEWERFHGWRRIRAEEHDPTQPMMPDNLFEKHMLKPSEWSLDHRFVVEADGATVGGFTVQAPKPGASGYESNKHLMNARGGVISPWRHKGIGTAGLRETLRLMDEHETTVLTVWSSELDGQAFIEWFGAEVKQIERISRLYMDKIDWAQQERWLAGLAARSPGTTLEFYPDRLPDEFLEEYCVALQELMNLIPWDDMDHGKIEMQPSDWHDVYKRLDISGADHHTYISREADGQISGITDVSWGPDNPDVVWQWFTGVHPDVRGRGVGKALKAAMALYVKERYSEPKWFSTGNAASNDPMLAINTRMGFREHKRYLTYQIGREDLRAFLDGLG